MSALIVVEDMERSKKFYSELLGQRIVLDLGANVSYKGGFALQTRETWQQFYHFKKLDLRFGGHTAELYFEHEDLDAFVKKLKRQRKVEICRDVHEQPWGQRNICLYDPDRHMVEIGESMGTVMKRFQSQGMSVAEIAARTDCPERYVRRCLRQK